MNVLSKYFNGLLSFIYPNLCLLCDTVLRDEEDLVCQNCWQKIPTVDGTVSFGLVAHDAMDEIRAGFYYNSDFQSLVHNLKYRRYTRLASRMSHRLYQVLLDNPDWLNADMIVPVPMHRIKLRERGYNQAAEIGGYLSAWCRIPCYPDVMQRHSNTVSQTKMSDASERVGNMEEVFRTKAGLDLTGKRIILIDDIITTGATANACARALKKAGAVSVRVLTAGRPYFAETSR